MPELLADVLIGRPGASTWGRWSQSDRSQLIARSKIGHLDVDLPRPQFARHLCERRDGELGEVPVPLSPRGLLAVGQVERVDGLASLPSVVWRRVPLR